MTICSCLSINPTYFNTVIAFNNSGVVLKDRSCEDLVDLAIIARKSNNANILKFFENLPALSELQALKMRLIEQRIFKSF